MKRHILNLSLLVAASGMANSACAHAFWDRAVPVGVHGVNYSDATFSYIVTDPKDESNAAGGEIVSAYSAGGTMCCYSLPKTWKPGIVVDVNVSSWPKVPKGEKAEEVRETFKVEVPEYKEVGELWVLRLADGKVALVSSNVGPTHERWAGPVKGGPVPSLEFRQGLWEKQIKKVELELTAARKFLRLVDADIDSQAKATWDTYAKHQPKWLEGYSSSADPKFRGDLKQRALVRIKDAEAELQKVQGMKP